MTDRLEHAKSLPFPAAQQTPATPATEERFSDGEMAEIKRGFALRFKEAFGHASNASIARQLGVQQITISPYSKGERLPLAELLLWISVRSGCSVDWLLTGNGPRYPGKVVSFSPAETAKIQAIADRSGKTFDETARELAMASAETVGRFSGE